MEIRCSFGLNRFVYVNRIKCAYMRENVYLNAFVSITSEVIQYFKDPLMMLRLLDKECPSRTTKIPNLITITSATSNHHPFLSLNARCESGHFLDQHVYTHALMHSFQRFSLYLLVSYHGIQLRENCSYDPEQDTRI